MVGIGITVFGTIPGASGSGGPISTYRIEDDPSASSRYEGVQTDEAQYGVNFYNASGLDLGRHVLVITNEASDAQLALDYFTVTGPSVQDPSMSVRSSQSSSFPSTSPSVTSEPTEQVAGNGSTPIAPIIGGVVGGVVLISFLIVGLFLYKRRQRRRHTAETEETAGNCYS